MSETELFKGTPSPHIKKRGSVTVVMYLVVLALLFPTAGAVYFFGVYSLMIIITSITTAILVELVSKKLRKQEFVMDGSAVITGLLLALVLPPRIPLWAVVIGSAIAIAIAKEAFGGLGHNIFNPALVGRAFLVVSFPVLMTRWIAPVNSFMGDAVSSASPLAADNVVSGVPFAAGKMALYEDLFFGNVAGSLGETSALLILIGGMILLALQVINWRTPLFYIGTVFLLTWILPGEDPVFHILAGGLFLGAFFMATDYVTGPLTDTGKIIFAVGAGVLVVAIRVWGGMPEGVAFSILIMNAFTPLIDRHTRPRPFGFVKKEKEKAEKGDAKEAKGAKDGKKEGGKDASKGADS